MEVIGIANQKGGVGKTTTCMNLAASLAVIGKKILVIDIDPQGNASTGIGIDNNHRKHDIYGVLTDQYHINDAICQTSINNLEIITSTVDLAAAELGLASLDNREFILKSHLNKLNNSYDYIIIDCPPSLNLLTINAMAAINELIIPVQCEFFALEGLSHLLKTIKLIRKTINPHIKIKGILLTMYDRRNKISEQVAREIKKFLGPKLFQTKIPRNVKISEAPSFGKPVIAYDHNCSGARAYIGLVKEILQQEKLKQKVI